MKQVPVIHNMKDLDFFNIVMYVIVKHFPKKITIGINASDYKGA